MAAAAPGTVSVYDESSITLSSKDAIGAGTFACVRLGQLRRVGENEQDVAIKIFRRHTKLRMINVKAEIRIMGCMNHENVLKLMGIVYPVDRTVYPWLVMEYMENGNMHSFMRHNSHLCDQAFKMNVTRSVVSAMKYMNVDMGIVHGDLHALNVLVSGSGKIIKVADFGLSFKIKNERQTLLRPIGQNGRPMGDVRCVRAARWKPPEWVPGVMYKPVVTRPGDVWAFGILLFELWNDGRQPFSQYENEDLVCLIIGRGFNPLQFEGCSAPPRILNIMHKCFTLSLAKRPTFLGIQNVLNDTSLAPIDSQFSRCEE